jgi:hypothetical protein
MKTYKKSYFQSKSWQDILVFYDELSKQNKTFEPMTDLVNHIVENYSFGVFALTSMFTLCLSQTNQMTLDNKVLRIDIVQDIVEFEYLEYKKIFAQDRWKKTCNVDEIIKVFDFIMLKRLKWFTN